MNRAIEIHDSSLSGITKTEGKIVIHLNEACVHESSGVPSIDSGMVYIQSIDLELTNPIIDNDIIQFPTTLSDGYLLFDGERKDNVVPLPISKTGEIELTFITHHNEKFHVKSDRITSSYNNEAKYIENYDA
jgi:hypothetical protein